MATNNKSTGSVTIVGDTAKVGATLLIGGVTIKDNDGLGDLHYQWLSDGSPIEQETGNRYTLTKNDIGKILNVKISYTDGADNAEIIKSTNTKKVAAPINNKPTGTITVTGDATKVGTELSITNTIKDKDGLGEFNYQWLRDGKAIDSATTDKYTLNQDDKGKTINLQVNYTDGAGYVETVKSTNTKKVAAGTTTTTPTTPIKVDLSGPTSVNEGSSATYTATLTKALANVTNIPYTLSGTGITVNGDEFAGITSASGNISIPAGSTTGSFSLNVINDLKTEGAETLTVKLGTVAGVTSGTKSSISTVIADTSVTATISDDYTNNVYTTKGVLTVGGKTTGNIETKNDSDVFKVYLQAGVNYSFKVIDGTLVNPHISLSSDTNGAITNTSGRNPMDLYTPTSSGNYYLSVISGSSGGTGTYVIETSIRSDSTINISDAISAYATASSDIYNVSSGNYSVQIFGFDKGDKLNLYPNAQISVTNEFDLTDGLKDFVVLNPKTGEETYIRFYGLTPEQDKSITDLASFNTIFGNDSISTSPITASTLPTINLVNLNAGYMTEGSGAFVYLVYLTNGVAPVGGLSIPYTISGTGITESDFNAARYSLMNTGLKGTIEIGEGGKSGGLTIEPAIDSINEEPETFVLSLGTVGGAKLGENITSSTLLKDSSEWILPSGIHLISSDRISNTTISGVDTFYISSGYHDYSVSIENFAVGDKLKFFTGAQISVVSDTNQTDGVQVISSYNPANSQTTTITLTGLTAAQDAGAFDIASFNAIFGNNSISTILPNVVPVVVPPPTTLPTVNLVVGNGGYMGESTGSYFYFAYLTNGVAPTGGLNIPYVISGNGITASDFNQPASLTGTINIPEGKNSGFIDGISPAFDSINEGTETFVLSLGAVSGVKLGTTVTTSTLLKDSSEPYPVGTHLINSANVSNTTTSGVDTFYISSGNSNYSASIENFAAGDKLKFFTGAEISIVPDTNQTDGIQVITAYNPVWSQTTTITLTGLTAVQDAGIFNVPSFNTVFGAGTLS